MMSDHFIEAGEASSLSNHFTSKMGAIEFSGMSLLVINYCRVGFTIKEKWRPALCIMRDIGDGIWRDARELYWRISLADSLLMRSMMLSSKRIYHFMSSSYYMENFISMADPSPKYWVKLKMLLLYILINCRRSRSKTHRGQNRYLRMKLAFCTRLLSERAAHSAREL